MASVSKTNEQDIITFAAKALQEFSRIATGLSVKEERHCLGALGAQAFLICLYLNVSEDLREEWLGRKLPKLLKDLCLFVCGVSNIQSSQTRRCLQGLALIEEQSRGQIKDAPSVWSQIGRSPCACI